MLDGHEAFASYLSHCDGCLERTVETKLGERPQYYHRHVTAMLIHRDGQLLLDAEPQLPGEGETVAAMRLLKRILHKCPRAFNLVCGDALHIDPDLWKLALRHNKHFVAVLKNENRDLLTDARSLFDQVEPVHSGYGQTQRVSWDIEGFKTWSQLGKDVRVVRSMETTTVRRRHTKQTQQLTSEWVWATSLTKRQAGTQAVITIGHRRWCIENNGFNELANNWHADHRYKHHPNALLVFLLLTYLAYNLFHAMVARNIKPQLRAKHTQRFFADLITAEFYQGRPFQPP